MADGGSPPPPAAHPADAAHPPAPARSLATPPPPGAPTPAARLAVVGDVHGQWGPEDEAALAFLAPTAACFVGDFGEEDTALVDALARPPSPPAPPAGRPPRLFVLGNHDAWYCLTSRGRDRVARRGGDGSAAVSPGVRAQLEAMGGAHVGWGHALVASPPAPPLAIAGARPFSKGGGRWSDVADFYAGLAGVASMEDAGARTAGALRAARAALPPGDAGTVVLLAHNGPAGLGAAPHDPCGADFLPGGGDWGDPDTAAALAAVAGDDDGQGASPAAVIFGHMHRNLRGDPRPRDAVRFGGGGRSGRRTVFLNAAVTPRRRVLGPGVVGGTDGAAPTTACHFLMVELAGGAVTGAADVWVGAYPLADGGFATAPLLERPLLVREEGSGRRWAFQAHAGEWVAEGG